MTERRRLVLDLAATSRNWALTPSGLSRLRDAAPAGWEVSVVSAPTSSDGDGPQGGSDESKRLIADAEVYFGFGITADLVGALTTHTSQPAGAAARRRESPSGVNAQFLEVAARSSTNLRRSVNVHPVDVVSREQ